MLPPLPLDVHREIIRTRAAQLLWSGPYDEKHPLQDLASLCLVSRDWKVEAQRLLLEVHDISNEDTEYLAALLDTLKRFKDLRPLVRKIVFTPTGGDPWGTTKLLLRNVDLVPNLQHLLNYCWPVGASGSGGIGPAPRKARPVLASLSVYNCDAPTPPGQSLDAYFDLRALQALRVTDHPYGEGWSDVSLFAGVPDGVETLVVSDFLVKAFEALMRALRRQTKVIFLTLTAVTEFGTNEAPTSLPAGLSNPLVAFPKLRALCIGGFANLDALLDVGHRSLETLYVASLSRAFWNNRRDAGKPSPLHVFVARLCAVQRAEPIRFPALQAVRLCETTFAPYGRNNGYKAADVRDLARKIRDVGLLFQDESGRVWRDEWFDEVEGADA